MSNSRKRKVDRGVRPAASDRPVVGWREWVALPSLGIDRIKAKIDTGARTSVLHAYRIKPFRRRGKRFVRFYVHPVQNRRLPEVVCEAPVIDERVVTSSNGEQQYRYVVEAALRIGDLEWLIELTLTNRDEMSFRMLLGRQALRKRLLIDPGASFRTTRKPRDHGAIASPV